VNTLTKKTINDVKINIITYHELLEFIANAISNKESRIIDYLNANTVVQCNKNIKLSSFMNNCDIVHADGVGVYLALKWLYGKKIVKERINGTDFYFQLLSQLNESKSKVYCFGDTTIVLDRVVRMITKNYQNIGIAGVHHGYVDILDKHPAERIAKSDADIVFVGLGCPLQEEWVEMYRTYLGTKVCLIVGGGLSFLSGVRPRAPVVFRWLGIEWIFRLLQEPKRMWRRYLFGIPKFMYIIFKQKISK